ncbi:endoplasmic reticulum resident protein 27 isoform 2-T2 [Synchiropus picturatus]
MLIPLIFPLLVSLASATQKDADLPRLNDITATQAFINSSDVVVIGFLEGEESSSYKELAAAAQKVQSVPVAICSEKEVWVEYGITSDTITLFRKADNYRENLVVAEAKKVETDGLVNFFTINETAVGLFNSEVKVHVLLFANRGSKEFSVLKKQLGALAPEFTGKFLFVVINGSAQSNFKALGYFGLDSKSLPRVGIYDGGSDKKWLMPAGEITAERVREFCHSFLQGDLKDATGEEAPKSEL